MLVTHKPSEELLRSRIHDVWVAEVAALENQSIYDYRSFILYRQHEGNVVGAYIDKSFSARLFRKVNKLKNSVQRNGRSKLAKEIYKCFPEHQSNEIIRYLALSNTLKGKFDLFINYNLFSEYDSKLKFYIYIIFNLL